MLDEVKRAKFQAYLDRINMTSLDRTRGLLSLSRLEPSTINERLFKGESAKAFGSQYLKLTEEEFEALRAMWNQKFAESMPLVLKSPKKEKEKITVVDEKARKRFLDYLNTMPKPEKEISEPEPPVKRENESEAELEQCRQVYAFSLMGRTMMPKDNESQFDRAIADAFKPAVMEYGCAKKADPNFKEFRSMWNEKWGEQLAVELEVRKELAQKAVQDTQAAKKTDDKSVPSIDPILTEQEKEERAFGLLNLLPPETETAQAQPPQKRRSIIRDVGTISSYVLIGAGIGAGFGLLAGPGGVAAGAVLGAAIGAGVGVGLVILGRVGQRWLAKHPEQQARVDKMNDRVSNRLGIANKPPAAQIGQQNTQTVETLEAIVTNLQNQNRRNSESVNREKPEGPQTPPSDKTPRVG